MSNIKRDKYDKQDWIIEYLKEHPYGVDILNKDFVQQYIEEFKPKCTIQPYGAWKCTELNRILNEMYHCNMLNRDTIGLPKMEVGFPKWVYVYTIKRL